MKRVPVFTLLAVLERRGGKSLGKYAVNHVTLRCCATLIGMQSTPGDEFSGIFEAHEPSVRRFLIRRGAARSDIPDLVAEVFSIAWQRREDLPTEGHARGWLLVTARNVMHNHIRKSARDDVLLANVPEWGSDTCDPANRLLAWELQREVWISLNRLSEVDKELLLLTGWDGLSPAEASAVLSISSATVRVRLHRARKRFATELTKTRRTEDDPSGPPLDVDLTDRSRARQLQQRT